MTIDALTGETVELLQTLIRNACVNEGTPESGDETRNAEVLRAVVDVPGVDIAEFEIQEGRGSLVARLAGTDPEAPAVCLMGHTDVVPVSPEGWIHDPFGGELLTTDGVTEVWGRGAVDMLNLTASMAVAFRRLATAPTRPRGDVVFFAVADEEAGSALGAAPLVADEWDTLRCDFVLTEYGGTPTEAADGTVVLLTTAEKGGSPRRIVVHGEPGHGSMPYRADSALIKAAEVVRRVAAIAPEPRIDDMFRARVRALGLDADLEARLVDPARLEDALAELPIGLARNLHSCAHMSFSPNVLELAGKTNVIPGRAELVVDIRILHGDTPEDADRLLREAIGDELMASVEILPYRDNMDDLALEPSASSTDTAMWDALVDAVRVAYPGADVLPSVVTGGTDARFFRKRGVPAYGAGLLSHHVSMAEFLNRFHGHNERIDIESLRLTTQLWLDVLDRLHTRSS